MEKAIFQMFRQTFKSFYSWGANAKVDQKKTIHERNPSGFLDLLPNEILDTIFFTLQILDLKNLKKVSTRLYVYITSPSFRTKYLEANQNENLCQFSQDLYLNETVDDVIRGFSAQLSRAPYFVHLIGPKGCGKKTFISSLCWGEYSPFFGDGGRFSIDCDIQRTIVS